MPNSVLDNLSPKEGYRNCESRVVLFYPEQYVLDER